jgi:hypothetical protein
LISIFGERPTACPKRIADNIFTLENVNVPVGVVDITLYRDDLAHNAEQPLVRGTELPFNVDKYNIILVFALLMLQGLVISFWDFVFHREISDAVSNWTYDEGMIVATNKALGMFFYFLTFILFLGLYYYFYSNALKGKIVVIKNFYWLTDSVAFWLRIKTPTMKFRGKNKRY